MNTDQLAWALDLAAKYLFGLDKKASNIWGQIREMEDNPDISQVPPEMYLELERIQLKIVTLTDDLFPFRISGGAYEFQSVARALRKSSESNRNVMLNIPVGLAIINKRVSSRAFEDNAEPSVDDGFMDINL